MMGRLKSEQAQLFYHFQLDDVVPEDHLVRKIDTALDLSWRRFSYTSFCCTGPITDKDDAVRRIQDRSRSRGRMSDIAEHNTRHHQPERRRPPWKRRGHRNSLAFLCETGCYKTFAGD